MTDTPELGTLHRALGELRSAVGTVRARYGEIPAVRRIVGDLERLDLDVAELDVVPAPAQGPASPSRPPLELIDDTPIDAALWADADDEGVGGYHGPGAGHPPGSLPVRGGSRGHGAGLLGGRSADRPQR